MQIEKSLNDAICSTFTNTLSLGSEVNQIQTAGYDLSTGNSTTTLLHIFQQYISAVLHMHTQNKKLHS